ncbi:MAG TPA: GAF domain-containing sensor histidine kinase [Anaerolineales bacterium]|nr:GAF domain-containing sensor histidine kinase [Anaerolineales bacterium]
MNTDIVISVLLGLLGALQLGVAGFMVMRRGLGEWAGRALILYALLAGVWQLTLAIGRVNSALSQSITVWISAYAVILLALLFVMLTRYFLRTARVGWQSWAIGAVGLLIVTILLRGLVPLPVSTALTAPTLALGASFLAWASLIGITFFFTVHARRTTTQPLHRNRILYWAGAAIVMALADLVFFASAELGNLIRLAATVVAAYLIVNHRLPDVRRIRRWLLLYSLVTVIAIVTFLAGAVGLGYLFQTLLGYDPWAALALTAVLTAITLNPLVQLSQQLLSRRIVGAGYDAGEAVGEYSANINNILDIVRLTDTVTQLISETTAASHVRLMLVDHTRVEGRAAYRLRAVPTETEPEELAGTLAADNPVAAYLSVEGRPLAQYDIDLLPRYSKMAAPERTWFSGLHVDVYVPIKAKGDWIGLLAVGPKATGDRYYNDDMTMLGTLADQTAIALENARLVANLVQLNIALKQALADLEKAHRQLNELDRLKSQFIGAITHELRTPVANIQFSIQLIEKYGLQNMLPEQQEQMYQLINATKHAKVMVDNLVAFATFISKQGELKLGSFSFSELLGEAVVMLEPHARRKDITLRMDVTDPTASSKAALLPIEETQAPVPPIVADRGRMGDAVYHLVQNAIKFTGVEGTIVTRCWAKDGNMHFEVTDTGVGVPPDKLPTLWEGFTQMADPEKRGVEGLGLGLALVKYVVHAHDGEVYADSTPGKGSTFGFRIPLTGPKPRVVLAPEE